MGGELLKLHEGFSLQLPVSGPGIVRYLLVETFLIEHNADFHLAAYTHNMS